MPFLLGLPLRGQDKMHGMARVGQGCFFAIFFPNSMAFSGVIVARIFPAFFASIFASIFDANS